MSSAAAGAGGVSFASRLQRLFATCVDPDSGRPWRNIDIVRRCSTSGHELSESHLSELRRGIKSNPTVHTAAVIARAFDVPMGYFTDAHVFDAIDGRLSLQLRAVQEAQEERRRVEGEAVVVAQLVSAALTNVRLRRLPRAERRQRTVAMNEAAALLNEQSTLVQLTTADFGRRHAALMRVADLLGVDQPSQLS